MDASLDLASSPVSVFLFRFLFNFVFIIGNFVIKPEVPFHKFGDSPKDNANAVGKSPILRTFYFTILNAIER